MTKMENASDSLWWRRYGIKGHSSIAVGAQTYTAVVEISKVNSQKIRNQPQDIAIPRLSMYQKEERSHQKDISSTMFIATLFIIARTWRQLDICPSTEEWIKKMGYIYIMEYYSAVKYNDTIKFAGKWTELEKKSRVR